LGQKDNHMPSITSSAAASGSDKTSRAGVRFRALNAREAITSPEGRLPLVIEPEGTAELPPVLEWVEANAGLLNEKLCLHGGLLFRGFKVTSIEDFEWLALKIDPALRDANPLDDGLRAHVSRFVFGATHYSPLHTLPFHNEDSYLPKNPARIMFCCLKAPVSGGETLIVDCRSVYKDLSRDIVERFREKTLPMMRRFNFDMLSRNMRTSDKQAIEATCQELGADNISWSERGDLILRCKLPVVIYHEQTGEPIWFNRLLVANPWSFIIQACFSTLKTRNLRLKARAACLLPAYLLYFAPLLVRQSLSGKGQEGEDEQAEATRPPQVPFKTTYNLARAYWKNAVVFTWKEGDVLVLDNRLVAHGRMPFRGERSILTCVTQATWPNLSAR
jgi:alpha-ketoglutarate-dependent taurine dioxygenase